MKITQYFRKKYVAESVFYLPARSFLMFCKGYI